MKVVIAPDSFKGSLTAFEVCDIDRTWHPSGISHCRNKKSPISDGGEGLVRLLLTALDGQSIKIKVHDPLSRIIEAEYGVIGGHTAVIEIMAAASGLPLLMKAELNPLLTNTYGTGELIVDAVKKEVVRRFYWVLAAVPPMMVVWGWQQRWE